MSRESVKLDITAFLSTNSDEQNHEHQRLYERLVQRVTEVVADPEFEPIDVFVQGTGMYWLSERWASSVVLGGSSPTSSAPPGHPATRCCGPADQTAPQGGERESETDISNLKRAGCAGCTATPDLLEQSVHIFPFRAPFSRARQ